jgi:hypothetical protein
LATFLTTRASGAASSWDDEDVHVLRQRLTRQRVLHIALNQVERGILHLCCRLNLQARSAALRSALASIFRKASLWLSPSFKAKALSLGRPLALAAVNAALSMGNRASSSWIDDEDYILLLGVNSLGGSPPLRQG